MQETRPGLDVVRMEGYEKEPVFEFPNVAKCDQANDELGDAEQGLVTAEWRKEKVWAGRRTSSPGQYKRNPGRGNQRN